MSKYQVGPKGIEMFFFCAAYGTEACSCGIRLYYSVSLAFNVAYNGCRNADETGAQGGPDLNRYDGGYNNGYLHGAGRYQWPNGEVESQAMKFY